MRLAHSSGYDDIKKTHSLQALAVIVRGIFAKSLSGWEIMETLAGSVNESDAVFNVRISIVKLIYMLKETPLQEFTGVIANIMQDSKAPGVLHGP